MLERVQDFSLTGSDLVEYAGTYRSDEAEATCSFEVTNDELVIKGRYSSRAVKPVYPDAFAVGGKTYIFRRDESGRITEVSFSQGRVWDLRFKRPP